MITNGTGFTAAGAEFDAARATCLALFAFLGAMVTCFLGKGSALHEARCLPIAADAQGGGRRLNCIGRLGSADAGQGP